MSEESIVVAEEAGNQWDKLARIEYHFNERGISFWDTLRSWELFKEALADRNEAGPHVHLFILLIVVALVAVVAGLITFFT